MKTEDRIHYVYGLTDPLSGIVRYIGTTYHLMGRLQKHLKDAKREPRSRKEFWVKDLLSIGLKPGVVIIEKVSYANRHEREIFWIAEYRSMGFDLTNMTEGGKGGRGSGFITPLSTRQKQSKALMGLKRSPEEIEKSAAKRRGLVPSLERVARAQATRKITMAKKKLLG